MFREISYKTVEKEGALTKSTLPEMDISSLMYWHSAHNVYLIYISAVTL
jgi:hypothetical protein